MDINTDNTEPSGAGVPAQSMSTIVITIIVVIALVAVVFLMMDGKRSETPVSGTTNTDVTSTTDDTTPTSYDTITPATNNAPTNTTSATNNTNASPAVVEAIHDEPTNDTATTNTVPATTDTTATSPTTEVVGIVREVTVTGNNFSFSPSEIRVKRGDTVRVLFKNANGTHDWRLEGYSIGTKVLSAGAQETVEFVADKTGTFEYFCSVGPHRAMGMVGNLIVE